MDATFHLVMDLGKLACGSLVASASSYAADWVVKKGISWISKRFKSETA